MNIGYKTCIALFVLITGFTACHRSGKKEDKTVHIIFDSDIGPDYDDVGAITILHVMADQGEAKILATVASNKYEGIAGVLDVFNTYFHRSDIPIGVPKGDAVSMGASQHWTDTLLAKYPHAITRNDQVPDAVALYRRILSEQPDQSVTIVTVGFLTNMANLLASAPDSVSSLSGMELIKKKVKLLVTMGGKFPSGREFNIFNDPAGSRNALENWPTKVLFSGSEIGEKIKTGLPLIHDTAITGDPAKDVFSISIPLNPADSAGRMSWDETTVLVAVRGYEPYFDVREGKIRVADDGGNTWDAASKGQFYLVEKMPYPQIADTINALMMKQPLEQ